jgi:hypothetical protein
MVQNLNLLLDEGKNKFIAEGKMQSEIKQIDTLVKLSQKEYIKGTPLWDSDEEEYIEAQEQPNPNYKRPTPSIQKWINADDSLTNPKIVKWEKEQILKDTNLKNAIYRFLGIIPFNPSVMINISPNWKGKANPKDKKYLRLLNNTIHDYINACNRYSKYRYCLECGGDGNFLHAHIVAEINPDLAKSVLTHINKGNHKGELMKAWDKNLKNEKAIPYNPYKSGKEKGSEGLLKGKFAVQRILLNHPTLRDDKLKYLIEANKPEGHTNAYDLNFVKGDF